MPGRQQIYDHQDNIGNGTMPPLGLDITWFGPVLAFLRFLASRFLFFTTSQTKEVAKLGGFKIQTTEQSTHVVPQALSAGVLALGSILIGAGLYQKALTAEPQFHSAF